MNIENLQVLEPDAGWTSADFQNEYWLDILSEEDHDELHKALVHAKTVSKNFLEISVEDFPLDRLSARLKKVENELMNGRGFSLIRGLDRSRYGNDDMCLLYWGIGLHLGNPWPQNKHGHMLGDVTDQGKAPSDPTSRGNELGGVAMPYHSDGSDLVGLMCLKKAKHGGLSTICNALAIHNELVKTRPDLVAELYKPQPVDYRGEEAAGRRSWYEMPVFSVKNKRLFVRYIRPYIKSSQRHASAPRITLLAEEAMQLLDKMTQDQKYTLFMDLEPGDMQIINNYHLLHARTAYEDDVESGDIRHLKRLWLETEVLTSRPKWAQTNIGSHWGNKKAISRLDAS
ncbi:MAG: hypothetical protein ACI9FB_002634 [Candidatus Azotimanducaceae bacterium]|jgi:hypothetical protein